MFKSKLKDLELLWDPDHKEYYLRAKYEVEDDHSVREVIIPHITLPVRSHSTPDFGLYYGNKLVNIGFGEMVMRPCDIEIPGHDTIKDACYVEHTIKEKPQEMTIEEIEKKLGYKIKIVGEKHE